MPLSRYTPLLQIHSQSIAAVEIFYPTHSVHGGACLSTSFGAAYGPAIPEVLPTTYTAAQHGEGVEDSAQKGAAMVQNFGLKRGPG